MPKPDDLSDAARRLVKQSHAAQKKKHGNGYSQEMMRRGRKGGWPKGHPRKKKQEGPGDEPGSSLRLPAPL